MTEKETLWKKGMKQFHRETMNGGGAFQATIIRAEHSVAMTQTEEGCRYLKTIAEWFSVVRAARQRPLCLACEHEFGPDAMPLAFWFAVPFCGEPTQAIV